MMRASILLAGMFATLSFAASASAGAQVAAQEGAELVEKSAPAFICSAQTEGQLTCQANKQCSCRHKPGDAAAGLPARWAWDCGIMRPRCEVTPADTSGEGAYPLPPLIIEHQENDEGGE